MRKIFNRNKKEETIMADAPVSPETPGEIKEIERLNNSEPTVKEDDQSVVETSTKTPEINYREIPVCMSQAQINNLIIENNIMLKQIISNMDD